MDVGVGACDDWRWIMDLGFWVDSLPDCNGAFDGSEEDGKSFCAGFFIDAADGGNLDGI